MRFFASPGVNTSKAKTKSSVDEHRHKVLVADDDPTFTRRLCEFLREHGFEVRHVTSVSDAKNAVEFWHPDSVFIDLMLPETNALSLFKFMQTRTLSKIPRVIVMSKQTLPQGIETMRRAGATDYLVKPFPFDEVFRVIDVGQIVEPARSSDERPGLAHFGGDLKELHLVGLLLKQAQQGGATPTSLYNLTRMVGLKVQALRCSLIRCIDENAGLVVASNDDENIQGLPLRLQNYPEIREVRKTGRPLVISNIRTSSLLAPVRGRLEKTPYESLAVFPLYRGGEFYGVLSLRMEQQDKVATEYTEKFGTVCSQIISLAIAAEPS